MTSREEELVEQVRALVERNKDLTVELMFKAARLSELGDESSQKGHNLCWKGDQSLQQCCPNPDNPTFEEFLVGCLHYAPTQFKSLTPAQTDMVKRLLGIVMAQMPKSLVAKP